MSLPIARERGQPRGDVMADHIQPVTAPVYQHPAKVGCVQWSWLSERKEHDCHRQAIRGRQRNFNGEHFGR